MGVDSGVGQTSVENSDFSKFYVRDKLVSLNLANLEMDENSANDKISRSKGSTLYGLSHEDTVKEFNDNTDLSVSSLANSCGTERKLQDNKASGKFVRHTVTLPIVEAFYPKPNVETGEGSAKPSSANVSSDSPKDATADEVTNVSNSITTKLDNNVEKKEAVESDEKKEAADDDKIEVTKDEKKEAAEEDDKKEAVESDEKKEAAEEDDKKETAEDEKKEAADDDKIEVTKDEKKEAADDDKKETVESDEKKEAAKSDEKKETAELDEKKETVESDEKKETADDDKIEVTKDEKKEAADDDKKETAELDEKKEAADDDKIEVTKDEKKEAAEEDDKKETAELDEKKETADDDKIEVTKDEKKETAESDEKKEAVESDEKKETAELDEKKETVESDEKKEAADDDKIEVTKDEKKETAEEDEKKEAAEEDEKKETVESDDKKDSLVMEQNTDTDSSQKRRRIHKRKSSQINQVTASPTTQDMNQSTKELNTSKDGLYADNLKLENINNIALINTSSPPSTEVHPSSTALPVVPDAVLLSNKDKEQHRQIEAIVSKGKSAPESINKDDTNPAKSSEMSSPSMNSDHSHQPQYPGQYPRLSYDRSYHLRSNEGYRSKLYLKAKIVRKNIVEVHISSHQDVSCFIIGRSGLRSPKTTIYSTQGRTRRIHLSSWFTPYQVECGDNDVCTVTERFDE